MGTGMSLNQMLSAPACGGGVPVSVADNDSTDAGVQTRVRVDGTGVGLAMQPYSDGF